MGGLRIVFLYNDKNATNNADWLSVVDECKINSSTERVSKILPNVELKDNDVIVSFDVASLFTNVPVLKAIEDCTELFFFSGKYNVPPVDRDTFKELLVLCSSKGVLLSSRWVNPPAPHLANAWLSKFNDTIRDNATFYSRY